MNVIVCLSVSHLSTMFRSSYHHEISISNYHWLKQYIHWRLRSEVKFKVTEVKTKLVSDNNSSLSLQKGYKVIHTAFRGREGISLCFKDHPSNIKVTKVKMAKLVPIKVVLDDNSRLNSDITLKWWVTHSPTWRKYNTHLLIFSLKMFILVNLINICVL